MEDKNEKIKYYLEIIDEIEKVRSSNNMNWIRGNGTNTQLNCAGGFMSFEISGSEIGRFSSDDFLVGTTSNSSSSGVGLKLNYGSTNPTFNCVINQSAGNHSFYHLYNTNATHNAYRFYVMTNGGIANHSGNNSNLSDERMKKNITDMLLRMKYRNDEEILIDEFQAYYYSEKSNFFGKILFK